MTDDFTFTKMLNFSQLAGKDFTKIFNFTAFSIMKEFIDSRDQNDFVQSPNTSTSLFSMQTYSKEINATLLEMQTRCDGIEKKLSSLQGVTIELHKNLTAVEKEVQPLISNADKLADSGKCGFLNSYYHKLESRLCSQALPAVLYVGLSMFLNGLFGIFMTCLGLSINQRMKAW